jgi:aminoglycoside/choline kinase family phosphotransferase
MKLEQAEKLFIKELFDKSMGQKKIRDDAIVNVERLTGDASTRRYYRMFTKLSSYVICLDNPIANSDDHNFLQVQKFLKKNKIRVPEIYDERLDRGYLLEEDLGDKTLLAHLAGVESSSEEFNIYKDIIDSLLKMHKLKTKKSPINLFFDFDKLISEMNFTIDFFVKRFLNINDKEFHNTIGQELVQICKRLSNEKMVFTHRDFHSRNVMVKDNDYIIIDFQDARMGIPQYDLVSLLEDCYYSIEDNNKTELIKYYWDNLDKSLHEQEDFKYFMDLYNDMTIQRVFKAIGSFSFIYFQRDDHRYLKYVGFAMEKLKTLMLKDSRYDQLRISLFEHYYDS